MHSIEKNYFLRKESFDEKKNTKKLCIHHPHKERTVISTENYVILQI